MYDENNMSNADKLATSFTTARKLINNNDPAEYYKNADKSDPLDLFNRKIGFAAKTLSNAAYAAAGPIIDLVDNISASISNGGDKQKDMKYLTSKYVRYLDNKNPTDKDAIDRLYKGSIYNVDNVRSTVDRNRIAEWKKYAEDKVEEEKVGLFENQAALRNGDLFYISGLFDPNLPKEYERE